ncbi:MAG: 6-phosphogluconolactonase [Calditrichota bacterium]
MKSTTSLLVFENPALIAYYAAQKLATLSTKFTPVKPANIALSGGSTPKALFKLLSEAPFADVVQWKNLRFFWGDERIVPPDDPESNFGAANALLFTKLDEPPAYYRVAGLLEPEEANLQYRNVIAQMVPINASGLPVFDWIMLGMGSDGHTASIFPGRSLKSVQDDICGLAEHPETGQKRVSFTMKVINAARDISFLAAGSGKAEMLKHVLEDENVIYPAAQVAPESGSLEWCIDQAASAGLTSKNTWE